MSDDPYHNEFINTEDLLQEGFARELKSMGVDINSATSGEKLARGADGTFFMRPEGTKDGRLSTTGEGGAPIAMATGGNVSDAFLQKTGSLVSEAKEIAVNMFPSLANDKMASSDLEKVIRALEKVESIYGIGTEPFEKLRHLSGLKVKNPLENANRVVENTMENYETFIINDLKAINDKGNTGIAITVLGEIGGRGFISRAVVTAIPDFSGNEAIDYVNDGTEGMFTVKAFQKGRWVDVTDEYSVRQQFADYPLVRDEKFIHSIFVGEKILKVGKGIILEKLKLDHEDIKFGDHQIFCKDAKTVEEIKRVITAKDQG